MVKTSKHIYFQNTFIPSPSYPALQKDWVHIDQTNKVLFKNYVEAVLERNIDQLDKCNGEYCQSFSL
jgi:hypothetical protein